MSRGAKFWVATAAFGAATAVFCMPETQAAVIQAQWTFETSAPTTAGPLAAEVGSGSALGGTGGTYSTPAGNGSAHSFSSTAWDVGDYWQFSTPTTGVSDIGLTFDQQGSNTGPSTFKVAYSTDGTTFTDLGGTYTVINAGWSSGTAVTTSSYAFDLRPVTALNNAATIYLRLVDVNTTSIAGATVASGGTDRVDNVTIVSGYIPATPEPGTFGIASVVGLGMLARRRRRA